MATPRPTLKFLATPDLPPVRKSRPEVLTLRCTVQQQLRAHYDYHLASYNRGCIELGPSMGYQAAEEQLSAVYNACIEAREALHFHETAHRCEEPSGATMRLHITPDPTA